MGLMAVEDPAAPEGESEEAPDIADGTTSLDICPMLHQRTQR